MNNIFKLRNTNRLTQIKPRNSKTQSSHFWNKKPKELWSENMECLTLRYKTSDKLNNFKAITKTVALAEFANIRVQDKRLSQKHNTMKYNV